MWGSQVASGLCHPNDRIQRDAFRFQTVDPVKSDNNKSQNNQIRMFYEYFCVWLCLWISIPLQCWFHSVEYSTIEACTKAVDLFWTNNAVRTRQIFMNWTESECGTSYNHRKHWVWWVFSGLFIQNSKIWSYYGCCVIKLTNNKSVEKQKKGKIFKHW